MRFTEVPPPLEARVQQGVLARVRELVGRGVALHRRVNETVHDEELTDRTTSAVVDALRPGSVPFALFVVTGAALLAHACLVRRHADRILREHGHFLRDDDGENGTSKAHAD